MATKSKYSVEYQADLNELRAKRGKTRIEPSYTIADVGIDNQMLWVILEDERVIGTPLAWHPRLMGASAEQRTRWVLHPGNDGIHCPDVDEDMSVRVLMGHPS